ncbi:unnamed protein product [Notodromas monacha]|uniref:peptidylglycine monooxygenase n=1 Tax=Notodromas monacha TaxID=399045 RepID=A0A7R9GH05_9CRUS|nr:unnamed protein product [Notodromas monacha]CAG0920970.1 unnamed protein product [Notodromas monacha]
MTSFRGILMISISVSLGLSHCEKVKPKHKNEARESDYVDIRMPGASPMETDEYLCAVNLNKTFDEEVYITKFEPLEASADTIHHMLVFACLQGAKIIKSNTWNCGKLGVCSGPYKVMFAWAMNAPPVLLPKHVGFHVAAGTTLAIQIHYARALGKESIKDNSGMRLHYTKVKPKSFGALYMLVASYNIIIPPHKENVTADINCFSKSPKTMHIFGFRTHAHDLGTVITSYKYFPDTRKYELFAKGNPQWPQTFYPINPPYKISHGDIIAARCVYNSTTRDTQTINGRTRFREMCNLYLMYYTDTKNDDVIPACVDDELRYLSLPPLPESSLIPPPKNPVLEEYAHKKLGHTGHLMKMMAYGMGQKNPLMQPIMEGSSGFKEEQPLDPSAHPASDGASLNKQYLSNPSSDSEMDDFGNQRGTNFLQTAHQNYKNPVLDDGQGFGSRKLGKFIHVKDDFKRFLNPRESNEVHENPSPRTKLKLEHWNTNIDSLLGYDSSSSSESDWHASSHSSAATLLLKA